jgi:hypothetical protein
MNVKLKRSFSSGAKVKLSSRNAETGKLTRLTGWRSNLILDVGLNYLANNSGNSGYAGLITYCKVGSGTTPNSVNSGGSAIFSQATNVVTASTAFFTSAMVGAILKYGATGSSGTEQYITAYTSPTQVTVSSSATVAAIAGTVWFVQQTGLQTYLYQSNTYPNGGSYNGYTISNNVITYYRTFNFSVQASPYNVNEVGYDSQAGSTTVLGRIVLGTTVTVPTTDFLVVEIQISVTQSPGAPLTVSNVGTGLNTAGQIMWQAWNASNIDPSGARGLFPANGSYGILMDTSYNCHLQFYTGSAITLQGSIQNSNPATSSSGYDVSFGALNQSGNPVGYGTSSANYSFTTAGETCSALVFGGDAGGPIAQLLVLNLTTPVVLPVGSFTGSFTYEAIFGRTLVNP